MEQRGVAMKLIASIIFILSALVSIAHADWQSELKAVFDNVDTFDDLQDWTLPGVRFATIQNNPSDFAAFTSRTDGGIVWQTSQIYYNTTQNAIQDHGVDFRFADGAASNAAHHKSLVIDYNMKDSAHTLGVQRIAFQTGYGTGHKGMLPGG